ncbi:MULTISPECIES: lipid A-modifier LpxR family protein [unclassified Caulobacter]|uniref:lipid A-modifier LpxR family protein n=1 Tax=unclassified Caulobacter TaxID=2648921 RepID=UPI0009EA3599|nr:MULTISPECIES: lipid A-modifier LpxR family protein [unclassified Caulobacter]
MRTAGERTVFCLMAVLVAVVAGHATSACAAQKVGKSVKATDRAAPTADKAPAQISFKVKSETARPLDLSSSATGFTARDVDGAEGELQGGFAVSSAAAAGGDVRILDTDRYYDGAGPVTWRSNAFTRQAQAGGPIDSVRVTMAGVAKTAAVAPLTLVRPDADAYELQDVDVTVTRGWPAAVSLKGRTFALDVTPHAGVGFGGAGGSAEAGATVRLGKKKNMGDRVNDALGVREGDEAFGDRGRWYIFAAASGRAVGLNMLRGQNGDWTRAGLSQDVTSRLIGDSQAGVAWRRGPMQASLGYIHREIRAKEGIMGLATQKDDVVALSFSLKPHW